MMLMTLKQQRHIMVCSYLAQSGHTLNGDDVWAKVVEYIV